MEINEVQQLISQSSFDQKESINQLFRSADLFQIQNDKDYYCFGNKVGENYQSYQFCQQNITPQNSQLLFQPFIQSQPGQKQFISTQTLHDYIDNQKQYSLKRNRQSSKNSRQKKKLYYQEIQRRNFQNQKKIKQLTLKLRETEIQLNRLKSNSDKRAQSFLQVIDVCVDKLTQMINSQNKYQKKVLQQYCIQVKSNFGTAGKYRTDLLNYLMSQYMQHLLSDFQKYLMLSALQQKGFFGKTPQTQLDIDLRQILQIDEAKKARINKKYAQCYRDAINQFKKIRRRLYQCHVDLASSVKQIQAAFHPMKKQISSPTNFGKLIIFFNKNVHRLDIRNLKQDWIASFMKDSQFQHKDKIRKKIKSSNEQDKT